MSLYQSSVLKKFQAAQNEAQIKEAFEAYSKYFLDASIQENIRNSKEEQFQEGFLRELFVNILGYTINPNPDFNLTTELKNIKDAKKTDGAILKDGNALAVIELKGTDTKDLDKVTDQAFNYKNNQPECVYVVTSNFEKLRFFIHNAVEHVEFNLFTLTLDQFKLLWLFLQKDNLLGGVPQKVKEESLLEEEKVTKRLYKDYSAFKNDLWHDMCQRNPEADQLLLYKKSQKLLDRFLFIFFAEDKGLLPPNSITQIVSQWQQLKDLDAYKPLYERMQLYFTYMNEGRNVPDKEVIHAYNGGLFKADPHLDNLTVTDEVLEKHVLKLTEYDFETEVDTNILGHIFEHSLNDIENVRAQLAGEEVDKSKTKRKKDGVFYTPKYITKYIVDNTVGKLCEEKKQELGIDEEEFAKDRKGRRKDTLKKLDAQLKAYREWLLQLTICDPACGSGAFLNQALEFLMAEHRYVDELESQLLGYAMVFPDVENHILERNIYGVDINEESVEIARLSLWLRTAKKGRKLTSLSSNIKVGNSLIDDPEVAGDLAFNWQEEFRNVFQEKDKHAYHITTATHDSRTSQRMIDHKVRQKRDNGARPYPEAIWLEAEEEEVIMETIAGIAKEDKLNILAANICGDHLHLLLVCEEEEVPKIVKKIKGRTSRMLHHNKGINPLVEKEGEKSISLWTQKFGCKEITDQAQLQNTIDYINHNRAKHQLPHNKTLQAHIDTLVCSYEHAFATEYKGGFDVVIGNPPYVHLESIKDVSDQLSKLGYETFDGRGDLYQVFVEKGLNILRNDGIISFIMPNKWLQAGYGKNLREYFLKHHLVQLIDFGDFQIFDGATTYPCIFISRNASAQKTFSVSVLKSSSAIDFESYVSAIAETFTTDGFSGDTWVISSNLDLDILERLKSNFTTLSEMVEDGSVRGVLTGLTEAFIIESDVRDKLIKADPNADKLIQPVLRGRDIKPWLGVHKGVYMICTFPSLDIDIEKFPSIKQFFEDFGIERLRQIGQPGTRKKTSNKWFETQDTIAYYKEFLKPKIMYQAFQVKPCFVFDEQGLVCNNSMWVIPTDKKALAGVLNSKMGWWLINKYCTQIQNGCQLIWKYFGQIPVPNLDRAIDLENASANRIELTASCEGVTSTFLQLLQSKFPIDKPSKKLQNWPALEFKGFLAELKKKKVQLSLDEEAEWMGYFNKKKTEANALQAEIDKIDKDIDQMVYGLYGLTQEEIEIVENS